MTGMALTFVFVALIPASVIALVGSDNLTQVATLSWGRALGTMGLLHGKHLALLAMLTYWGWWLPVHQYLRSLPPGQ
jgi:hypothetical protein